MISLKASLILLFLVAVCIFSFVYSFIDNHDSRIGAFDFLRGFAIHVLGFGACAILISLIQGVFGQ